MWINRCKNIDYWLNFSISSAKQLDNLEVHRQNEVNI
jgi:hypothetical protein